MTFLIFTWLMTAASLVGVVANVHRKRWSFGIWLVTNSGWAAVDFYAGLPAQGCLFLAYAGLAVWGLWKWKRES